MDSLEVSELRYRRLFETALDGILLLNAKTGQVEDVNPYLIEMLGYSHGEFLGKYIWELGVFSETELNKDAFLELQKKRFIRYDNLPLLSKDGRRIPVEFVSNVYDCGGIKVIQCNIRDNTKRYLAEIAALASKRALQILSEGNAALLQSKTETILFDEYCRIAVETGGYQLAWISVAMEAEKPSTIISRFGREAPQLATELQNLSHSATGDFPTEIALRKGLVHFIEDIAGSSALLPWRAWALNQGFASIIAIPFALPDNTQACLTLFHPKKAAWSGPEEKLFQQITDDLSFGVAALRTAIDKTRYQYRLRESLEQTIQAIAAIVEERDAYTAGHQRRVAAISSAIAAEMGLSEELTHGLHLAAAIHDLGKISIPSDILAKPARLTANEFSLIKDHPAAGYKLLKGIAFPWPIAEMVFQHHERIDGSGYPNGLKGDELLLESKILAVADIVEAMASHRPYRPSLGLDAALQEITKQRGLTLDAEVVDACLRIFNVNGYTIEAG